MHLCKISVSRNVCSADEHSVMLQVGDNDFGGRCKWKAAPCALSWLEAHVPFAGRTCPRVIALFLCEVEHCPQSSRTIACTVVRSINSLIRTAWVPDLVAGLSRREFQNCYYCNNQSFNLVCYINQSLEFQLASYFLRYLSDLRLKCTVGVNGISLITTFLWQLLNGDLKYTQICATRQIYPEQCMSIALVIRFTGEKVISVS